MCQNRIIKNTHCKRKEKKKERRKEGRKERKKEKVNRVNYTMVTSIKNMEQTSSSSTSFFSLPFLDISILKLLDDAERGAGGDEATAAGHQSLSRGRTPAGAGRDGRD